MNFAIKSVTITNYRQYRGTNEVNFTIKSQKNVCIIHGKNGAGKSNFLNAITWCLYGIEAHKEKDERLNDGMPLINTTELEALKPNEETAAEVSIFLEANGIPWTITRSREGYKTALGEIKVKPEDQLRVIYQVDGQDKFVDTPDAQILINNLLPPALRSFFFIDGEQLREFFRISSPKQIAEAIDRVSQLELMYVAQKNLHEYQKDLSKSVSSSSPQLEKIQTEIEVLERKIKDYKENKEKIEERRERDFQELQEVKNYLKDYNDINVKNLTEKQNNLEKNKITIENYISKEKDDKNQYLVDTAPYIYLKSTIEKSYKTITKKIDAGQLPPKIRETFVDELLEKGECICGNKLIGEVRERLEEYKTQLAYSEFAEISVTGKVEYQGIFDKIKEFPERIDNYNQKIDDFTDQLEQIERGLEQVKEELSNYDRDEIRRFQARREELQTLVIRSEGHIKDLNFEIENCKRKLEEKRTEEERELRKESKYKELNEKLQIVREGLKVIASAIDTVKLKIRKTVEKNTDSNFKTLIRKKGAFNNVFIDDQYIVKVFHKDGYNVVNDLSAGEYLILGLSFMSSLMSVSGFKAPVIIDTPLGKIDDEHREYITSELPKFLEGTQLLLLVTPTEYDHNVQKNLEKFLIPENYYRIIENENSTESKVVSNVV